jgi:hypothetical protein
MRKLCIDEIGGVKMKKQEKKAHFVIQKNVFYFFIYFATPLALHFKDDL